MVPPSEPRAQGGTYWGYTVRLAASISRALKEGPHRGYDLTLGMSRPVLRTPGPPGLLGFVGF